MNIVNIFGAVIIITEGDLICLRSETPLNRDGWICAKHQFILGMDYRPSSVSKYFEHRDSTAKGIKVSWELYKFVKSLDKKFVLGSMICKRCQGKLRERIEDEPMDCDDTDDDSNFVLVEPFCNDIERLNRRRQSVIVTLMTWVSKEFDIKLTVTCSRCQTHHCLTSVVRTR